MDLFISFILSFLFLLTIIVKSHLTSIINIIKLIVCYLKFYII